MDRREFAGFALASAAAGLLGSVAPAVLAADENEVKCWGVNSCKGKSDCKEASASCKGQNSCKGQGFVFMSRHACEAVGGKVKEPAAK